ncbi:MAG: OpgC domain-containing protein, partial [Fibrobacteraceae bacterium]
MGHSKRIRALDSIRGLLLLQMTLDHFSGPISHYFYQCFGFFSAAEGFFFLSGFVGMLAVISKSSRGEDTGWMRKRAFRIWKFHISTVILLCVLAFLCLPKIATYFAGFYEHPVLGSFFAAILAYTPEWLDVLPLYVFLLLLGSFAFPLMVKGKTKQIWGASFIVWLLAQGPLRATVLQIFPSWMYAGFFDLFAWQFVYVSGAAISALWKQKYSLLESSQTLLDKTSAISVILCVICFIWSRGFLPAINPPDFLISKEHVGILRYLNFMAFVGVISFIVRHKSGLLDFAFTATLGKHSLEVYSAHTVCVYLWLATPNPIQGHLPFNLLAPIFCCFILWIIAKLLEKK